MIQNLKLKLSGELPVTRNELFQLVNSWGRTSNVYSLDLHTFEKCKGKQCYPLENLDVSQIDNMNEIFMYSPYNGDLSKWDVSKVEDMTSMFEQCIAFDSDLNNWNVKKVLISNMMFSGCISFTGRIENWDVSGLDEAYRMFNGCKRLSTDFSKWKLYEGLNRTEDDYYDLFREVPLDDEFVEQLTSNKD